MHFSTIKVPPTKLRLRPKNQSVILRPIFHSSQVINPPSEFSKPKISTATTLTSALVYEDHITLEFLVVLTIAGDLFCSFNVWLVYVLLYPLYFIYCSTFLHTHPLLLLFYPLFKTAYPYLPHSPLPSFPLVDLQSF